MKHAAKRASYQAIKADVLQRIRDNIWPPGTLLPGEIELAEEFQCARATVNRAMRELADEGVIDRKRKSGTRVKTAPTRQAKFTIPLIRLEIENAGKNYRYAMVHRQKQTAPRWLCGRLALHSAAQVLHLQCIHYADESPFQYEARWINLSAVPKAESESFEKIGPNEWLINHVPFTEAELTFSAKSATKDIAAMMSLSEGASLLTAERTTWLSDAPVTYAQLYFHQSYKMTTRI